MTEAETLLRELEDAAAELGLSPATVGRIAGQGGHFYKRLKSGRRVWPETARAVRERIQEICPSRQPHSEGS